MTAASPAPRARRRTPLLAAAALAVLSGLLLFGIPGGATLAQLSAGASSSAQATVGSWCAVPSPATTKNVYPVSSFAKGGGNSRYIIVPVVRGAEYAPTEAVPGAVSGQLGIRLWGCSPLPNDSARIKATAWRGNGAAVQGWATAPAAGTFSSARLSLSGRTADALEELHDDGDDSDGWGSGTAMEASTSRYSWILDEGRSLSAPAAHPTCSRPGCDVEPRHAQRVRSVFSVDDAAPAAGNVVSNSATYLASRFYAPGGGWPASGGGRAQPTVLEPSAGQSVEALLADNTGSRLQWVVLEVRGSIPADYAVEVFVS